MEGRYSLKKNSYFCLKYKLSHKKKYPPESQKLLLNNE